MPSRWVQPADLNEGDEFATWDDGILAVHVLSKPVPCEPHPRNGRPRVAFDARSAGSYGPIPTGPFNLTVRQIYADEPLLLSYRAENG